MPRYESVDEYANALLGTEDSTLSRMRAEAEAAGLPRIQVPPEMGRLLTFLVKVSRAQRILEIGTLFGYSTVILARALPEGGKLVSLEVDPRHAGIARENLQSAGLADRATIVEGSAHDTLAGLHGETFDLVFIDADKGSYPAYLEASLRLTRPGSIIVADNVWRGGGVTEPSDENTTGAARFNDALAANPRLLSLFVASRGGQDAATVSLVL
jgi:predicted O-methyltransferase YrrM